MKKLLKQVSFMLLFICFCHLADSQILKNLGNRAKEKIKTKTNEKVDKTMDKGVEKASEKIDTTVNRIIKGKDNNPAAGPGQLVEQGKYITTSIKFDDNSDQVKGESYVLLKDVAEILKQHPELRVKIVCHTDTDGDPDVNLKLSKVRAASVKSALVNVFGIDDSRLESDGEGGNNPVSKNKTEEGKALNRRVEFLKI